MHVTERARLRNELRRFRLAQGDMRQVIAAVTALQAERLNEYLCRALETAIVVCYWRPFGEGNAVGSIGSEWPALERFPGLHAELRRLRDQVYAHTDKTGARDIVDVGEMLGLDGAAWTEGWHPIRREVLPNIAELARQMDASLHEAAADRQERLDELG